LRPTLVYVWSARATVFILGYRALGDPHSFPTRRSSDLATVIGEVTDGDRLVVTWNGETVVDVPPRTVAHEGPVYERPVRRPDYRSEEHTSELQSRENLVCRPLLEKKKTAEEG